MVWYVITTIAAIPLLIKIYAKLTCGRCENKTQLTGKTVLITGCTAGIGKATAFELASRGARIVMGCRDLNKSHKVIEEIKSKTGNENIVVHKLDLESFASIREFAKKVLLTEPRLDILINNAGMANAGKKKTEDGNDMVIQVNYLGPFLLTNLLLDLLKKSTPSRIINVASSMHYLARLNPNNLNQDYALFDNVFKYSNTKLGNILMTNHLAERLKDTGVTVNCLHPGVIPTGINRRLVSIEKILLHCLYIFFEKSVEEGAQTTIYLATSDQVANVTGRYFSDCRMLRPSKRALDKQLMEKVWNKTEKLVHIKQKEFYN